MKKWFLLSLLALAGFAGFSAEPAVAAATPTPAYSEEDFAAAYRLFDTMKMDWQLNETWKLMVSEQIKKLPPEAGQRLGPVMLDFFLKYCSFEALKTDLAGLYLNHYSRSEIDGLTAFYASPLGQKMVDTTPQLSAGAMELSQKKIEVHAAELQAALEKALQPAGN